MIEVVGEGQDILSAEQLQDLTRRFIEHVKVRAPAAAYPRLCDGVGVDRAICSNGKSSHWRSWPSLSK